jgi:hypothetical protein
MAKNLALSTMSLFACLMLAEVSIFIFNQVGDRVREHYPLDYFRPDSDLGYEPNPGKFTVQKYYGDRLLFSAQYTINSKGIRETPFKQNGRWCNVVFSGGSNTFGEGVGDVETMPYYFQEASGGKFRAYNLGFHGYGPHQMLRTIETGRIADLVDGPFQVLIYQGIVPHVDRVAGKAAWDLYGPRYTVDPEGKVEYKGPFHGPIFKFFNDFLKDSLLYTFIRTHLLRLTSLDSEDIPLYLKILGRAKSEIENTYGAHFIVLFWDRGRDVALYADQIIHQLNQDEFQVNRISQIIPDIQTNEEAFILSPYDPHPNPRTNRLLGEYLAEVLQDFQC